LQEARLSGSATIMQFACEEIAELAQSAAALAKHLEHTLAEHRRRNPEAGIRRK
jgi:type II secretory pathway component PulJ